MSTTLEMRMAEAAGESKMNLREKFFMSIMCFVAIWNSATQGYDSSMMNGLLILPSYTEYFQLSTAMASLNVSIVFVGCVVATPFAGWISDKYGRKKAMAATALLAMFGAALQSAAVHVSMFCIGRFIVGMSITTGSACSPAYISEVSHPKYRVMLTGVYGATWYVGSLLAALLTFGSQYITSTWAWRMPSLLQFLPSILCLIPLPFIPESPRWLIYQDRHEEAKEILIKYHGAGDPNSTLVALEYEEILQTLEHEKTVQKTSFKALVETRPNRWRFGITLAVGIFTQISGNNIIAYYLGSVLDSAGIKATQSQLAINIGMSAWNLLCALVGSALMDKVGRRPASIFVTVSMGTLLLINAILTKFYLDAPTVASSAGSVFLIFLFYGCFSLVWTPLAWIYPIEVLSYSLRANGLAAYSGSLYLVGFLNTYAIPYAMEWSSWGFYLITALWCLVGELLIVWFYFPETKNMTLEEIDMIFDGEKHADLDIGVTDVLSGKVVGEEKGVVVETKS